MSRSCSLSFLLSLIFFFLSLYLFLSPYHFLYLYFSCLYPFFVLPLCIFFFQCFPSLYLRVSLLSLCISSRVPLSFPQYLYICLLCSLSLCYQFLTISYTKDSLNTTGSGGGDGERRNNSLLQSGTEAHEPMRDHMFPLKALF